MNLDTLAGINPYWAAAIQTVTNPFALRNYVNTRALMQDQLWLQTLLPPVFSNDAQIRNGNVRIVASAAKATALDSPYHPVGGMKTQFQRNTTFKISGTTRMSESDQDNMHSAAQNAIISNALGVAGGLAGGGNPTSIYTDYAALTVQAGLYALDLGEEKFRAMALAYGKLDFTQGSQESAVKVQADFNVDVSASSPQYRDRSTVAKGAYSGNQSAFWQDNDAARMYVRGGVEPSCIVNPGTFAKMLNNPTNRFVQRSTVWLNPTTRLVSVARAALTTTDQPSGAFVDIDTRYVAQFYVYGLEDELTGEAFWPDNRLTWFSETQQALTLIDGTVVGGALGVTHIGPNTELGQIPGRYLAAYVPEGRPYQFVVEESEDILPEIQNYRNLFLAKSG